MTDYSKFIEERLDYIGTPKFINEAIETDQDYHVSEAPQIKGHFGLISLKYMRRVKDIKNMCVEYINTYIDACMNVVNKMKDEPDGELTLQKESQSLAKSLSFKSSGASTGGKEKEADTIKGVAFLTGDKALADKMQAILNKIKLRAQKSEQLTQWAQLMIEQSKIVATEVVFEETNKVIKDESKRINIEDELKEAKAEVEKQKQENDKLNKAMDDIFKKHGDLSSAVTSVTEKDIEAIKTLSADDFNYNPVNDEGKLNQETNNSKLPEFRNELAAEDNVLKAYEEVIKNNADANYDDQQKQYIFSAIMLDNININKKLMPSFPDVAYVVANSKTLQQELQKNQSLKSKMIDVKNLEVSGMDGDALIKVAIKDVKQFMQIVAYLYSRAFSEAKEIVPEKPIKESTGYHVMSSDEFLNESLIKESRMKPEELGNYIKNFIYNIQNLNEYKQFLRYLMEAIEMAIYDRNEYINETPEEKEVNNHLIELEDKINELQKTL